jgi:CDGSH-type Zn-finger protein
MSQITITVRKDGPYRVELAEGASLTMVDHEGNAIALPGPKFSLCRCGASSRKPFCDGTHSRIGFKGAEEAARQFDAQGGAASGSGAGGGAAGGAVDGAAGSGSTGGGPAA